MCQVQVHQASPHPALEGVRVQGQQTVMRQVQALWHTSLEGKTSQIIREKNKTKYRY